MVEERLRYAIRFLSRHSKDFSLKEWRQINNPNYTKLLTLPDSECAVELLRKVNLDGKTVLGDKAFSSAQIRDFIQSQKAQVCIPDKVNSLLKHDFDHELYKARNVVERFFLRIKNHRHIATRYDKLAKRFLTFIHFACILIWLL